VFFRSCPRHRSWPCYISRSKEEDLWYSAVWHWRRSEVCPWWPQSAGPWLWEGQLYWANHPYRSDGELLLACEWKGVAVFDSHSKVYSLCSAVWSSDLRIKTTRAWSWPFHHHIIWHLRFIVREVLGSNLRPFDYPVRCCMHFFVAPLIINLGTGRKWMLNFMLWPLYPKEKNPWYPLNRMLVGPQSQCGHYGEEKKCLFPAGNRTQDFSVHSLVTVLDILMSVDEV